MSIMLIINLLLCLYRHKEADRQTHADEYSTVMIGKPQNEHCLI